MPASTHEPHTGLVLGGAAALGAYQAIADRGLRPGTDIAVTGWDDIQLARFVTPALTTVRQPMAWLGETAATLLAQRVAGGHAESQTLPSEVVIRASCGCAHQPPTTREVVQ